MVDTWQYIVITGSIPDDEKLFTLSVHVKTKTAVFACLGYRYINIYYYLYHESISHHILNVGRGIARTGNTRGANMGRNAMTRTQMPFDNFFLLALHHFVRARPFFSCENKTDSTF